MIRDFTAGQIALAVLGIGLLIAWHELGHYLVARLCGMRVLRFSIGFGPRLFRFRKGEIDYQVAALPFGGFVQIAGMTPLEPNALADPRSFINAPRWARAAVLLAGPGFNYLLAFVLFLVFHLAWPGMFGQVTAVAPGSPAAAAGLEAGDLIVQIDRKNLRTEADLLERLVAIDRVELRVFRTKENATEEHHLTLTAAGIDRSLPARGLEVVPSTLERAPLEAVQRSFTEIARHTVGNLQALGRLVAGDPEVSASGPIGIVRELKEQAKRSAPNFLWLLGVLSVSLGLLNLLPIPALDGIKVLVLAIEGLMRRDVNPVLQLWVNAIGLLVFLVLMVVLSIGDVRDLIAG